MNGEAPKNPDTYDYFGLEEKLAELLPISKENPEGSFDAFLCVLKEALDATDGSEVVLMTLRSAIVENTGMRDPKGELVAKVGAMADDLYRAIIERLVLHLHSAGGKGPRASDGDSEGAEGGAEGGAEIRSQVQEVIEEGEK